MRQRQVARQVRQARGAAGAVRRRPGAIAASRRTGAAGDLPRRAPAHPAHAAAATYDDQKRDDRGAAQARQGLQGLRDRIAELEARIAERERPIKDLEAVMAAPGFYDEHDQAKPVIDQHQALMWEVGDLLSQWEMLQAEAAGVRRPENVSAHYIFVILRQSRVIIQFL